MSTGQIVGGIIGAVIGFYTPAGPLVSANSDIGIGCLVSESDEEETDHEHR